MSELLTKHCLDLINPKTKLMCIYPVTKVFSGHCRISYTYPVFEILSVQSEAFIYT